MNKDNAAQYLPLVKALAEGKTIEFQASPGRWTTIAKPDFSCTPEYYRIKREPKVRWAIYDGGVFVGSFASQEDALNNSTRANKSFDIVKLVEAME